MKTLLMNGEKTLAPSDRNQQLINVLFIIDTLQIGGAENQVITLATALSKDPYRVQVCCLRRPIQAATLQARGIPFVSLNMRLRYWPVAVYKLFRLIRQVKPQIVHTHLGGADFWGKLVSIFAGVPVIFTTKHGMPQWKNRIQLITERLENLYTDKVIAVSEEIRQYILKQRVISPEKIITIPNSVDIERFSQADSRDRKRAEIGVISSELLIGTVARLVQVKRLDYLLEAAHTVCEKLPETRFVIIGDGPLREKLEVQASQLNLLPQKVMFLGSRVDIPELLSALDIFVLSSETEGLPVSMLEAMAALKPVIVPKVGAIPQVILDRQNGLLISPHDPAGLAEAILTLAEDDTLRRSLAVKGNRTVETRYSTNAISSQILALYDRALQISEAHVT
jgi:glycosyltransferase involved in cell wall biosynthesis